MELREKLADICDAEIQSDSPSCYVLADAVLAAIRDGIKPLEWEKLSEMCYRYYPKVGGYNIRVETYDGHDWSVLWSAPGICDQLIEGTFSSHEKAKGEYFKLHVATICAAIGLEVE